VAACAAVAQELSNNTPNCRTKGTIAGQKEQLQDKRNNCRTKGTIAGHKTNCSAVHFFYLFLKLS
jgi:hypothetical protein